MLTLEELDMYKAGAKVDKDDPGWTLEEFRQEIVSKFGESVLNAVLTRDVTGVEFEKYLNCADFLGIDIEKDLKTYIAFIDPSKLCGHPRILYDFWHGYDTLVVSEYREHAPIWTGTSKELFDTVKAILDKLPPHKYCIAGSAALARYKPDLEIIPNDIDIFFCNRDTLFIRELWELFERFGAPIYQENDYPTGFEVYQCGPVQLIVANDGIIEKFDSPVFAVQYWNGEDSPTVPDCVDECLESKILPVTDKMRPDRYFKYRKVFEITGALEFRTDRLVFNKANYEEMLEFTHIESVTNVHTIEFNECTQEQIDAILPRIPCKKVKLVKCVGITLQHRFIKAYNCSYCVLHAREWLALYCSHHCNVRCDIERRSLGVCLRMHSCRQIVTTNAVAEYYASELWLKSATSTTTDA